MPIPGPVEPVGKGAGHLIPRLAVAVAVAGFVLATFGEASPMLEQVWYWTAESEHSTTAEGPRKLRLSEQSRRIGTAPADLGAAHAGRTTTRT